MRGAYVASRETSKCCPGWCADRCFLENSWECRRLLRTLQDQHMFRSSILHCCPDSPCAFTRASCGPSASVMTRLSSC